MDEQNNVPLNAYHFCLTLGLKLNVAVFATEMWHLKSHML